MRRLLRGVLEIAAVVAIASPLAAQSSAVSQAAGTITKEDVARHLGVIADDSMMGRDTPSPGLEKTAQYVADQFKKFGLKPGGDNGTFFQRYTIEGGRRVDFKQSRIVFAAGGKEATAEFTTAARLAAPVAPEQPASANAVVVSGIHTQQSLESVSGKLVIYVVPTGLDTVRRLQTLNILFQTNKGLVILSDLDSANYNKRLRAALQQSAVGPAPTWAAHVRVENTKGVAEVLLAAGVDVAKAHADTTPVVKELPDLTVRLDLKGEPIKAPNTVGILKGSDPKLKDEYIVFSAHMDHVGLSRGLPDSINNGADDDGSGTVGIIELAEAFSRNGARPKRSMIFLTVSGEEKGLWGSDYFSSHPPVPIGQIVADINLDMIGRNWKDTVVAIGKEHSDLGATLNKVTAAHPELGMTAIDDMWPQEQFYFRSDHYNFAKNGVPILFFFSGVHPDYHQVTDSPDKIDTEKEARILRLVYYLGQDVGNAAERPKWHQASYDKIVQKKP